MNLQGMIDNFQVVIWASQWNQANAQTIQFSALTEGEGGMTNTK